jgi:hypothetical protein
MNVARRFLGAIFSTDPLSKQRPFWPLVLVCVGGMLISCPTLLTGHRNWTLCGCGLTLAGAGLILTVRYVVLQAAASRRSRATSRTKAV